MTATVPALLADIRERATFEVASAPEAALASDVARLIQALEAVAGLHKPVTYWMTHEDADVSYQTKEDALEDRTDLVESDLVPFDLCTHCKVTVERAAREMFEAWSPEASWDRIKDGALVKNRYRAVARRVLAAAVKEDGE